MSQQVPSIMHQSQRKWQKFLNYSPLCSGAFASLAGCTPRVCTSVQALAVFARTQGKQPDLSPRLVDGIIQSVLLRSAELRWIIASAA